MITVKEKIKENAGFQYIVENLQLMSSAGRRKLLAMPLLTSTEVITTQYDCIEKFVTFMSSAEKKTLLVDLQHQLMRLHDIQGTLHNLSSHVVLDEIELFELKSFAFICMAMRKDLALLNMEQQLPMPDTQTVFQLLDPDKSGVVNFYIYDSYSEKLREVRQQLKGCDTNSETYATLFAQQNELQQQVIEKLSQQLWNQATTLSDAFEQMTYIDLIQAMAVQALEWNLCRPTLSEREIDFHNLFNPRLKQHKEQLGLRYQAIDIHLNEELCIVTGANMAGKTVMLKSLSIAQLMAQFGMFVPAERAILPIVEDVMLCIGDEQNEMNGLSSFASEITKINTLLQRSQNERLLILIDEPARTTNPLEGKAIVQALGTLLKDHFCVITTHYSQLGLPCRKLRVKGFVGNDTATPLTPENINQFMDYALVEDNNEVVPHEALRIAALLGCDSHFIQLAETFSGLKK